LSVRAATEGGAASLLEQLAQPGLSHATGLSLFLHGREPGLRVPTALRALLQLKTALVFAPDLAPGDPEWPEHVADLIHAQVTARSRRLELAAGFMLDDEADAFATLAGQPSSLSRVLAASRALVREGLPVRWVVPVTPALLWRLDAIFSLAKDEQVDAVLTASEGAALGPDELLFARDFIRYRLLSEDRAGSSAGRLAHYEALLGSFDPDRESSFASVPSAKLELDGDSARQTASLAPRPAAAWLTALDSTPDAAYARSQKLKDIGEVALEGQKALWQWAYTQASDRARPDHGNKRQLQSVLLIGAYGGEHIGDIAILGGVLFRIHRRYGTTRAILVSQRADHTRHLVPMLETPVSVSVAEYDQATIANHLAQVDGVVFAGGPLMDLPKQLTKHLYTVSLARRMQKPFVAEGIGAGPFARKPSEWVARRLLRMAERVSVRTTDDAKKPLVRGLLAERGQDPAFDYLATRPETLTRIPDVDRPWLTRLVAGTEGRLTVAINIRPIGHLFTAGAKGQAQEARTIEIEKEFYAQLADGLRRFQARAKQPVTFIFFPMNAIQFGMCDLRSAYRLGRHLGPDLDYRVWEGDASLDGVVELLRKMDVVITMRFHATIFALSQKRAVVGIDYRPGKRDKVAALLDDCGKPDQYCRIDELTGPWLADRLADHEHALSRNGASAPTP
jgi:polysaccharide pyruvyl transferase WcaK-like protein